LAAYVNKYAQPPDRYNIKRSLTVPWRSATQGERELHALGDFSRVLPELLNPSLKSYFETLTERDRFIVQMDIALEPWDVWLLPAAATAAFTHRPAWTVVEVGERDYPHGLANGVYTMPFNLSGHPAVVIPTRFTQAGLPMGLQIVGKRWREMELFAIAQMIDQTVGDFRSPNLRAVPLISG
jgi:amidase